MNDSVTREWRLNRRTENLMGTTTGHRAEAGGPRRDRTSIYLVRRTANALILGLAGAPGPQPAADSALGPAFVRPRPAAAPVGAGRALRAELWFER